jgi:hypothetical protein
MRVCTQLTYAQSAEALILNFVQGRQFDLPPTISTFVTVCINLMRRKQVGFRDLDIARAQAKSSDLPWLDTCNSKSSQGRSHKFLRVMY